MKAEIKAKIDNSERHALEDVIPLETPYSVQIDVASACNLKCMFCFHCDMTAIRNNNVRFAIMDMDVYKKIIDDMSRDWGSRVKKLRLFAHGEPLLNKNLIQMASYAKAKDVADIIEITTNGTLIDDAFCEAVSESGIDIINISVNGLTGRQYAEQCSYDMKYDAFVENIRKLYEKKGHTRILIKLSDVGYAEEDVRKFLSTFGDICDQIFVEGVSDDLWIGTNIEGTFKSNTSGIYGREYERKKVCTSIFTTMVINSFGEAILCCQDWKNNHVIGDTKKESIADIWRGSILKGYQISFLEGKRDEMELCCNCVSPEITTPDNVDDHADELLQKIRLANR